MLSHFIYVYKKNFFLWNGFSYKMNQLRAMKFLYCTYKCAVLLLVLSILHFSSPPSTWYVVEILTFSSSFKTFQTYFFAVVVAKNFPKWIRLNEFCCFCKYYEIFLIHYTSYIRNIQTLSMAVSWYTLLSILFLLA